jgi:hypothetical protein
MEGLMNEKHRMKLDKETENKTRKRMGEN